MARDTDGAGCSVNSGRLLAAIGQRGPTLEIFRSENDMDESRFRSAWFVLPCDS